MTRKLDLHPWQESACDAWFRGDRRGTIKVVTGAGKTVVALAIIERLQRLDPELRVAIVVPTIVLMNQWRDMILEHSNLPEQAVGRLGGGQFGTFDEATRILIAVLASARKKMPHLVGEDLGRHVLLVADECHRVGAPEMSRVLDTRRAYNLGLSATPERGDDEGAGAHVEWARNGLGPIVYEMSFAQALDLDVLPPFEINHYGLPLTARESHQYTTLSNSITEVRRELLHSSALSASLAGGSPRGPRALTCGCRFPLRGQSRERRAGSRKPPATVERRLRVALQAAAPIAEADSPAVAQAWFLGMSPLLDDRSPLLLLSDGDLDEAQPAAIGAARAFVAAG